MTFCILRRHISHTCTSPPPVASGHMVWLGKRCQLMPPNKYIFHFPLSSLLLSLLLPCLPYLLRRSSPFLFPFPPLLCRSALFFRLRNKEQKKPSVLSRGETLLYLRVMERMGFRCSRVAMTGAGGGGEGLQEKRQISSC